MFDYQCDTSAPLDMNASSHSLVGYVTSIGLGGRKLTGLKLPSPLEKRDLDVVGLIERFTWDGSPFSPISLVVLLPPATAAQLKAISQLLMKNPAIDSLAWSIVDYDQLTKNWFERGWASGVAGVLAVDTLKLSLVENERMGWFRVSLRIAPPAKHVNHLGFADKPHEKRMVAWGSLSL